MKIRIIMKTPDCVDDAINNTEFDLECPEDEYPTKQLIRTVCEKWFSYGEICVLEVDTDKQTIKVIPTGG